MHDKLMEAPNINVHRFIMCHVFIQVSEGHIANSSIVLNRLSDPPPQCTQNRQQAKKPWVLWAKTKKIGAIYRCLYIGTKISGWSFRMQH